MGKILFAEFIFLKSWWAWEPLNTLMGLAGMEWYWCIGLGLLVGSYKTQLKHLALLSVAVGFFKKDFCGL